MSRSTMIEATTRFYFDVPMQKLDTGTARLACRRYGSGSPLLLVHGFPLSGFTWRKVLPELSKRHTCYVPDLPGMGESEWTDKTDFSFPGQAQTLKTLVDRLGLEHYGVLAQDTGGTFARYLALADGARLGKVVLINTEVPHHRPPWIPLPTAAVPARGDGVLPSAVAFQAVSALWHGFRRLLHRPRSARRRFSPARDPAPAAFHAQDGWDGPLPARLEVGAGGRSRAGACTHHDAGATDLGRRRSHLPRRVSANHPPCRRGSRDSPAPRTAVCAGVVTEGWRR